MPRHPVRAQVLIHSHEVGLLGGRAPSARHTGLGVDDHVPDHTSARERRKREQRRGRIAAGVRDQRRAADLLAVELRETVDGLAEQLGRLVLAVPAPVHGGVVQAEVGAQVDDADTALAQRGHQRRGSAMRIGDDGGVNVGVAVEVQLLELERHPVVRVQIVEPPSHVAARRDRPELERWMPVKQPRGQRTREPGAPEHGHAMRHGSSRPASPPPPRRSRRGAQRPPRRSRSGRRPDR